MRYASATGSETGAQRAVCGGGWPALLLVGLFLAAGCAGGGNSGGDGEERTVLLTRKGQISIQVTESEQDGNQIIRIKTVFRGEENTIVLNIDLPVYEVEIPLTLEQVMPQAALAAVRGPEGQFQDLLIAQWLQRAQQAMLDGDYNAALRQVDIVLQVQPSHIQAHAMKGSVYYALGNYQLANEEWEYVLSLDSTNKEVLDFQAFLKNRAGGAPPPLPGAPGGPPGAIPPGQQPPGPAGKERARQ